MIYDAHNHESTLKGALLGATRGGRWLARAAAETERVAVALASEILTTTSEDAELFVSLDGVEPDRLTLIENGATVAGTPFAEGAEREANRIRLLAKLGLGDRKRLAVFVGSGHPPTWPPPGTSSTLSGIETIWRWP